MSFLDGDIELGDVAAGQTLAAGGHAARHTEVKDALEEIRDGWPTKADQADLDAALVGEGNVPVPSAKGQVLTSTGTSLGDHGWVTEQPLNVADFGGVGDGSTDAGPALQAAHDALPAAGGKLILPTPSVSWLFSTSVTLSKPDVTVIAEAGLIEVASGIQILSTGDSFTFEGAGLSALTIDHSTNTGATHPIVLQGNDATFRGATVVGSRGVGGGTASCLSIQKPAGQSGATVEKVHFVNATRQGVSNGQSGATFVDVTGESIGRSLVYLSSGSSNAVCVRVGGTDINLDRVAGNGAIAIQGNTDPALFDEEFDLIDCWTSGAYGNGIIVFSGGATSGQPLTRGVRIRGGSHNDMAGDNSGGTEGEAISATCNDFSVIGTKFRSVWNEAVNWSCGANGVDMSGGVFDDLLIENATEETGAIASNNGSGLELIAANGGTISGFAISNVIVRDTRGTAKTRAAVSINSTSGGVVSDGAIANVIADGTTLGVPVEFYSEAIREAHGGTIAEQNLVPAVDVGAVRGALYVPSTAGTYVATPNAAALNPTGELDLYVDVDMADLTPTNYTVLLGKWSATTSERGYTLRIDANGRLHLYWSSAGTDTIDKDSTHSISTDVGVTGGRIGLGARRDPTSGDVVFYYRLRGTGPITQLGATRTSTPSAVFASAAALRVLSVADGFGSTTKQDTVLHRATVKDAGAVVADLRAAALGGGTRYRDRAGVVWTVNGTDYASAAA